VKKKKERKTEPLLPFSLDGKGREEGRADEKKGKNK